MIAHLFNLFPRTPTPLMWPSIPCPVSATDPSKPTTSNIAPPASNTRSSIYIYADESRQLEVENIEYLNKYIGFLKKTNSNDIVFSLPSRSRAISHTPSLIYILVFKSRQFEAEYIECLNKDTGLETTQNFVYNQQQEITDQDVIEEEMDIFKKKRKRVVK